MSHKSEPKYNLGDSVNVPTMGSRSNGKVIGVQSFTTILGTKHRYVVDVRESIYETWEQDVKGVK